MAMSVPASGPGSSPHHKMILPPIHEAVPQIMSTAARDQANGSSYYPRHSSYPSLGSESPSSDSASPSAKRRRLSPQPSGLESALPRLASLTSIEPDRPSLRMTPLLPRAGAREGGARDGSGAAPAWTCESPTRPRTAAAPAPPVTEMMRRGSVSSTEVEQRALYRSPRAPARPAAYEESGRSASVSTPRLDRAQHDGGRSGPYASTEAYEQHGPSDKARANSLSQAHSGPGVTGRPTSPYSSPLTQGRDRSPYTNHGAAQKLTYEAVAEVGAYTGEARSKRRRGNLPKSTTDILKNWFHEHINHPYPTEEEKQILMCQTRLTMSQISNWFINCRRRHLPFYNRQIRAEIIAQVQERDDRGGGQEGEGEARRGSVHGRAEAGETFQAETSLQREGSLKRRHDFDERRPSGGRV